MIKARCFICDEQIDDEASKMGMIVRCDYMFKICRECANNIGEVAQVALTRKEIRISDASLSYLQSDELAEAFCGECPWNTYEPLGGIIDEDF